MDTFRGRRSIRLKYHDYSSSGFYYVTICTYRRQPILSEVRNGSVTLSNSGRIVVSGWKSIPANFPHCRTDAFVAMPDHIHGVLQLDELNKHSLGQIIRNFKSTTARRINVIQNTPAFNIWQRNYYERVVRNEKELNLIRLYIELNPRMWNEDKEFRHLEFESIDEIELILSRFSS
jgi:putative transposase